MVLYYCESCVSTWQEECFFVLNTDDFPNPTITLHNKGSSVVNMARKLMMVYLEVGLEYPIFFIQWGE
jgi:hypothetical protein